MLVEANRLFSQGKFLQAAGLYEALAHRALEQHRPRTPQLFLLAGRANLLGGKKYEGVEHLKTSLRLLANAGRWEDLDRIGARVVEELEERGFNDEAQQVSAFVQALKAEAEDAGQLATTVVPSHSTAHTTRLNLPTNCAACGASVHPKEVEWADERTAVCSYCGNMVRAEDA
jgi:hypothetical protein